MWIDQRVGPFKAGKPIEFYEFTKKDSAKIYGKKYVRVGIQSPQAPLLSEMDRTWGELGIRADMCIVSIDDDDWNYKSSKTFAINANEILEFHNLSNVAYFKVTPRVDMDAYTIIEIQIMEEEEVSG